MTDTPDTDDNLVQEIENGLSPEKAEAIDDTFETEAELDGYINDERERRLREKERKRRQQKELREAREKQESDSHQSTESIEEEFEDEYNVDYDSDLSRSTARVERVRTSGEELKIFLNTRDGEKFKHRLDFALPEDTGSEWVRLCDWKDTNPARPTELRGEIVPTTIADNPSDRDIDIPPINGGLNPVAFKAGRAYTRFKTTNIGQKTSAFLSDTAEYWAPTLWLLGTIAAFFGYVSVVAPVHNETLAKLALVPVFLMMVSGVFASWYTFLAWGKLFLDLLATVVFPVLAVIGKGIYIALSKTYNTLFPSPD